ncbi:hypothetical protein GCM10009565_81760 [Amycolatopsis albidoflavus]
MADITVDVVIDQAIDSAVTAGAERRATREGTARRGAGAVQAGSRRFPGSGRAWRPVWHGGDALPAGAAIAHGYDRDLVALAVEKGPPVGCRRPGGMGVSSASVPEAGEVGPGGDPKRRQARPADLPRTSGKETAC